LGVPESPKILTLQRSMRQPVDSTKLARSQPAGPKLRHQSLDLLAASSQLQTRKATLQQFDLAVRLAWREAITEIRIACPASLLLKQFHGAIESHIPAQRQRVSVSAAAIALWTMARTKWSSSGSRENQRRKNNGPTMPAMR
jgi:hypothetical protein